MSVQFPTLEILTESLFSQLPPDQRDEVLKYGMGDIDPSFLGFLDHYWALSHTIPINWTIVDLGCAYVPQSFSFQNHHAYIGVDVYKGPRFHTDNTVHYIQTIQEFCVKVQQDPLSNKQIFAICSYASSYPEVLSTIHFTFPYCYTYYPSRSEIKIW